MTGVEQGLLHQADLLTGGQRMSARHGSMAATLDWSVALLDDAAARTLARLAVPVASFDPDAAVAVAGFDPLTDGLVRRALPVLAEHNLLSLSWPGGQPRYRMLEPIRQFGIARLDSQDELVFARHLAWCWVDIASVRNGDDPTGSARIADDARAALGGRRGPRRRGRPTWPQSSASRCPGWSLREAQARLEQAAELDEDGRRAASALAHAAAIARCRVSGPDALRLDLMAAERADRAGAHVDVALALTRAAETINRFSGMFGAPPTEASDDLIVRARSLAPHDAHVAAGIAIATLAYANPEGLPIAEASRAAQRLARTAGDDVLESAALDGLTSSCCSVDNPKPRIARRRRESHCSGRHTTTPRTRWRSRTRCIWLSTPPSAPATSRRPATMPFGSRRCAVSVSIATWLRRRSSRPQRFPGTGDRARPARRYLADWQAAGSPAAAGRALTPAAVALAHGLRDHDRERERWLDVLARIRGVSRDVGWRGSGYGELFHAMVLLHRDQPGEALAVLRSDGVRVPFGLIFHQWIAAFAAEAAVLARHPDAPDLLNQATATCSGEPGRRRGLPTCRSADQTEWRGPGATGGHRRRAGPGRSALTKPSAPPSSPRPGNHDPH